MHSINSTALETNARRVRAFVSFAHDPDEPVAERLMAALETEGFQVDTYLYSWRQLKPATLIASELSERVGEAAYFIPLLSEVSLTSAWVIFEIYIALKAIEWSDAANSPRVLPVRSAELVPAALPRVVARLKGAEPLKGEPIHEWRFGDVTVPNSEVRRVVADWLETTLQPQTFVPCYDDSEVTQLVQLVKQLGLEHGLLQRELNGATPESMLDAARMSVLSALRREVASVLISQSPGSMEAFSRFASNLREYVRCVKQSDHGSAFNAIAAAKLEFSLSMRGANCWCLDLLAAHQQYYVRLDEHREDVREAAQLSLPGFRDLFAGGTRFVGPEADRSLFEREAALGLIKCLLDTGQAEEATQIAISAWRRNPKEYELIGALAVCYRRRGERPPPFVDELIVAYVDSDPDLFLGSENATATLEALVRKGAHAHACKLVETRLQANCGNNSQLISEMAWLLGVARGEWDAILWLERQQWRCRLPIDIDEITTAIIESERLDDNEAAILLEERAASAALRAGCASKPNSIGLLDVFAALSMWAMIHRLKAGRKSEALHIARALVDDSGPSQWQQYAEAAARYVLKGGRQVDYLVVGISEVSKLPVERGLDPLLGRP